MPERFPPLEPVRARGAFASHAGPRRTYDDQAVIFSADGGAAFAAVVHGEAQSRSGRYAADLVLDLCVRIFRERTTAMLDDLAEVWWRAEHGAGEGARVRPFASLPIGERSELRARVKSLLAERIPSAIGDQAVLEGETKRLLDLPETALRRASNDIERKVERDRPKWAGTSASAAVAIFAAGQASIAHLGDCRAIRVRRGILDVLTHEHTLRDDHHEGRPPVLTRAVGLMGDGPEVVTSKLERGDLFLLASKGIHASFSKDDIRAALVQHGVKAAPHLVERGRENFADHSLDNVAAVAVEIL